MYKNDKISDINLEIKEIGVQISTQIEINEELKQNLIVNKKFKKEVMKEEVNNLKKQLQSKKLLLDQTFNKGHKIKLEIEDLKTKILNIRDKII